jgi:DNA-binding transcriptional regulator YbjK
LSVSTPTGQRAGGIVPGISARRKYNAPERRRELADAAIELFGTDGARGLSHPKVDQRAGVPAGTTSFYFRTRKALVQAIAERLTELDTADLTRMAELAQDGSTGFTGTAGFAKLVLASNVEPYLTRSRARYELTLHMSRAPELAETLQQFASGFYTLAREVIREWHGEDADTDPDLIDEQTVMVLTFVNGVMMSFVFGAPVVTDADHLDRWIQAILAGAEDTRSPRP